MSADTVAEPRLKLLPCPFCGTLPELQHFANQGSFHIRCTFDKCSMTVWSSVYGSAAQAAKAWNTRTVAVAA